jgi:hypothetical protein
MSFRRARFARGICCFLEPEKKSRSLALLGMADGTFSADCEAATFKDYLRDGLALLISSKKLTSFLFGVHDFFSPPLQRRGFSSPASRCVRRAKTDDPKLAPVCRKSPPLKRRATTIGADFEDVNRAKWFLFSSPKIKMRDGASFASPIAQRFAESYFFLAGAFAGASPTFVVIPTPIAVREANPSFACAPIGPLGSRSMAC